MSAGKREKYIDVAKGIAMICIILGHMGIYEIDRVVFTFHVPIFYIITGYFLSKKYEVKTFIKDKARTLLIPYGITCVVNILVGMIFATVLEGPTVAETAVHWILASVYGSGVNFTEPFVIHRIGAIWFLLASFWGCIFLRISLEMKKKVRLLFIIALFLVGYWSNQLFFWFPFSIQAGCCAALFMYVGYLARRSKDVYTELPKEVKKASIVFALIIWLAFIKNFESFWVVQNNFGRGVIDIFGSICGCFVVIMFSKLVEKRCRILTEIFAFIGKYSLIVLCVHILELNLFPWWYIKLGIMSVGIHDQIAEYMIIALRIVCILGTTFVFSKIKWITNLFGMKSAK